MILHSFITEKLIITSLPESYLGGIVPWLAYCVSCVFKRRPPAPLPPRLKSKQILSGPKESHKVYV